MASILLTAPMQGWATPIDEVPDAVFSEKMLGDGVAIDPTGDCLYAPCAGTVLTLLPSGHAITLATPEGAEILIHIGLDTVALGGRGFSPCVAVGDTVERGAPLIRFDLDLLVREARAVVTPIVIVNPDRFSIVHAVSSELVAVGDPLMTLEPSDAVARRETSQDGAAHARTVVVPLPHGIHARPAARLAATAKRFDADVTLACGDKTANVRSPIALLALAIRHDDTIIVTAAGADAASALAAICDLIESGMDEPAEAPVRAPTVAPSPARPAVDGALTGVTAAPGLAIGRARWFRPADIVVPEQGEGIAVEEARFDAAVTTLSTRFADRARTATGPERAIVEAHAAMLDDPMLHEATRGGIARGESAGHAWRAAIRPQADALRTSTDPRLAERADDMLDLERQLLALIAGVETTPLSFPPDTILLADDLLPSHVLSLDRANIVGFCVERGGPTSHVAILAATMGLPALVAIGAPLNSVTDETPVILDASEGLLRIDPDADTLVATQVRIVQAQVRRTEALARAGEPCLMADGTRIEAFANLGALGDAHLAVENGAEGSGLLRTEFLFLERDAAPTVAEQSADYQAIADALDGRPLIVRLLDIGGDKPAPYLPMAPEENPALGLRGIRVGLAHPRLLEDQVRAILSVKPAGQCRIMVPMIASLDELRAVRTVVDRVAAEIGHGDRVPVGVMIETPAAAVTADLIAAEADFLSVGTNDLTQYALAMDRGNAAVASGIDGLHPAVLRLIAQTCKGGAVHGRWTGVCGGLASDPLAVPILIGLGVTELSSAPALVPEIKALVATLTMEACRAHAAAALQCGSAADVRSLAREFTA
ncbi:MULTISPECIES: phosphoenolpyruvate--protein phosphotransferase [unclassified Sphingomonas]|uniref:phosphoenolpyruvate--protein phosphotransferase n=1 Tax=unclassified Sphingomonas TaxID=196159 RepID=UPI000E719DBD|nr:MULTISPECIES: phosphoenolpyruvate--protein phosphotransferase [unclassified Sphingomonas]RKE53363.1 phosphocarrier protein HPr /phosphoenolpyruvate--protein phosphotransferase /PTS system IIA component (Glc family) [Sphingomonas sp. PP-CC-1A-547]TCM09858.1 phosphocarrier protein HPr /phosphoenolpyruvate--protein phosphotransferase /PTS system IIA component (Glc family) [Sphingomonas sp. PP-CC-3G-468]